MKRQLTLCLGLLLVVLLAIGVSDLNAAIKVKTIGRSLNSMTPPIRGAAAPAWNISTGLRAVGKESRVYFSVDTTGSGAVGSPAWAMVAPPGSAAVLDSADGNFLNSVKVDLVGEYVISATVGGQTASDTVFASTYSGVGTDPQAGCFCHPSAAAIKTSWSASRHANIFKDGITGYLEVERGKGAYATGCIKCHTTGWDKNANNNNFGILAKTSGWDTTWYQGLEFMNGDYWIPTGDTSRWSLLNATEKSVSSIGCESCHGPLADHKMTADPKKAGATIRQDVCNQCHDGSRRHSLGTYFANSLHATVPTGAASEGGRLQCQPCHTGRGFQYYVQHGLDTTGLAATWNLSRDAGTPISCQVCHDPHGNANPYQLSTVRVRGDSLRNGYIIPANLQEKTGWVCATCHSARYSVKARVTTTPPYYGFTNRFGPHYNPQADMLLGSNGYQYGDESFTGLGTHQGLEGACATCHMQGRMNRLDGSANTLPNHSFSMSDTLYGTGVYSPVNVCRECHGEIEEFNDIRAFYDFDRNGVIEGVETEIQGLLTALKAQLPIDSTNGEPCTMMYDSLKVKNRPDYVQGIWNYYFVKNDRSMGAHNSKYAVRLLYKSLGWTPLDVKELPGTPTEFALAQNYPNPFNPTTSIRISIPMESHVRLQIFDMTGALVQTVIDEALHAGNMEVTWNGKNTIGSDVASGVYLYRLEAGSFISTKKMVLVR